MEEGEFIKIFSGTFIIVQLALDRLKSAGIHAILKDELGLGQHSGFSMPYNGYQEIYVNKEDLNEAVRIVEAVKSDLEA